MTQLAKPQPPSLIGKLATKYMVDPAKMLATLKATAFKQRNGTVTDEQMMALLVVADQHNLNPWTREIYAFPDKNNGIVPVVGVDGWSRILNEHPMYDGVEFEYSDEQFELPDAKPAPTWIECIIYRKDRKRPTRVREYLSEVYREPFKKDGKIFKGPWQTHTTRLLRHKALIQCARLAFSFAGIYDQDEAERIVDGVIIDQDEANIDGLKEKIRNGKT